MPITDMHLEDGLFFTREDGVLRAEDAQVWLDTLRQHATISPTPLVALVDALDVIGVTSGASTILAQSASTPNLFVWALATKNMILSALPHNPGVRRGAIVVFPSLEVARLFAERQAALAKRNHNDLMG